MNAQHIHSRMVKFLLHITMWLFVAHPASAQLFCIYDPLGSGGDYFSMFKDYQLQAKRWGVDIAVRPYTDDAELRDALISGKCDMASMIGYRALEFNKFTGTLDAPAAIQNYAQERDAMAVVANPHVAPFMTSNGYEIAGVIPIGAAFAITHDRTINSFERAKGKKVGLPPWFAPGKAMATDMGTIPTDVDLPNLGRAFNTGKVDIIVVPLLLYKAWELDKNIGTTGGIVRRPLLHLSMQLVAHADKFPPSFAQLSREYMYTQSNFAISLAHNLEASVDHRVWIYSLHEEMLKWDEGMSKTLEHLTKAGYYDPRMLSILKRIRCKTDTYEPECAPTLQQRLEAEHR